MSKTEFEKLNESRSDAGEEIYANARNTTSGTLKMQDSAQVARRNLDCYLYTMITEEKDLKTHNEGIQESVPRWHGGVGSSGRNYNSKSYRLV